jgi:ribosome recycling factor
VRRDARKALETAEKDGDISKDELERAEKELDKMTQEHVEQVDKAFTRKEQELLEV